MSDMRDHPTASRRRRHKSPANGYLAYLAPPALPDRLRDDVDDPTCSDEEKGAKRMRSASTTPGSFRGTDADDYDPEFDQWINQFRDEVQTRGLDRDAFHQRVTRFLRNTNEEKRVAELP